MWELYAMWAWIGAFLTASLDARGGGSYLGLNASAATTAVTELSPPAYVGTSLTTQTCVGFTLTMLTIWMIPPAVRWVGWHWAFATFAIGPFLGVAAMGRLRLLPEATRLAGGRR